MNILMCASEANPFFKTGGLADVTYSLSKEFIKLKNKVSIVLPFYKKNNKLDIKKIKLKTKVNVYFNGYNIETKIYELVKEQISFLFVENDLYFDRDNLYGYFDDGERFAFFSMAIIEYLKKSKMNFDIVHVNDWQVGMIPCLLKINYGNNKKLSKIKTVLTIHNPLFKGYFDSISLYDFYKLPYYVFENGSVELDGKVSSLKSAIAYSDKIVTVSKTHAYELTTPEGGFGLNYDLTLRQDDFVGILNGITSKEFNPKNDKLIYKNYDLKNIKDKLLNKKELFKNYNMDYKKPLFIVVSRLSYQKGLNLIFKMAEKVIEKDGIFAIIGSGDKYSEDYFNELISRYPQNVIVYIGYNDEFAHRLYSASDFLIMPSLFEPCGLSQMIAHTYGSLPIVRNTGGLKDSVIGYDNSNLDIADGIKFENPNELEACNAIDFAFDIYSNKKVFNKLKENAIKKNHSWKNSATSYLDLYIDAIKNK